MASVKEQNWKLKHEGTPLLPLVGEPIVSANYHVTWGKSKGVIGKCYQVNHQDRTVLLRAPKTGKPFKYPVPWSQLLHTRAQQFRIEQGYDPYSKAYNTKTI